jgi:hypothetical protein
MVIPVFVAELSSFFIASRIASRKTMANGAKR